MACLPAIAQPTPETLVHLLDYISVDYSGAVSGGTVRDAGEYAEMQEFAANVSEGISSLPERPGKSGLQAAAVELAKAVATRQSDAHVGAKSAALRQALIAAYGVTLGPRRAPDSTRARVLYAERCAGCHGASGRGDGPLAKGLDPAPTDFTDRERQRRRSVHGLYNTITLGVEGTAMGAFGDLSQDDRWGLAYFVSGWSVSGEEAARGLAAWEAGGARGEFRSHADVAGHSASAVQSRLGAQAADVHAYLRRSPEALDRAKPTPIAFARAKLAESVQLHAAGRRDEAAQAALAAYLDGFELVEPALAAVDGALLRRVESLMSELRATLKSDGSADLVREAAARVDAALEEASQAISGTTLSPAAAALASFAILLREGLEALLVVAALLAFLRRSGQSRAIGYLHFGWIAALVAGLATWAAATWLVDVSGAGRELTEGFAALAAAAMLLYVGFWLHDKSHAHAWQAFLVRGASSVGAGAAWGFAFMAFLAVYREVFETVLFYQALWAQARGAGDAIVAGFALGTAALATVGWAMLRYSLRLPLGLFFGASGLLLAALAVVLAGNGVAALQEAGMIPESRVDFVAVSWLGIHPNLQALGAQLALAAAAAGLFLLSRARARARTPPAG